MPERSKYETGDNPEEREQFNQGRLEIQENEEGLSLVLECNNPKETASYFFAINEVLKQQGIEVAEGEEINISKGESVIILPPGTNQDQIENVFDKIHQEAQKVFIKMVRTSDVRDAIQESREDGFDYSASNESDNEKFDFGT